MPNLTFTKLTGKWTVMSAKHVLLLYPYSKVSAGQVPTMCETNLESYKNEALINSFSRLAE